MKSRGELKTEQQNLQSSQIDSMSINDILNTINREDQNIAIAVQATLPDIGKTQADKTNQNLTERSVYMGMYDSMIKKIRYFP